MTEALEKMAALGDKTKEEKEAEQQPIPEDELHACALLSARRFALGSPILSGARLFLNFIMLTDTVPQWSSGPP